jgi:hypothetical protein
LRIINVYFESRFGKTMRLFDLELHFSVVQDAKNIIQTLFGNKVEVVIWYLSKKWQKQENTTET